MPAQLILEFHGIGSPHGGVTDKNEPMYWLSRETFASLLQAIVVTREGSDLPVAITFDDGNESDALIALPELAKRNLKAIFFVVGGRIVCLTILIERHFETLSQQGWRSGQTVCTIATGASSTR